MAAGRTACDVGEEVVAGAGDAAGATGAAATAGSQASPQTNDINLRDMMVDEAVSAAAGSKSRMNRP